MSELDLTESPDGMHCWLIRGDEAWTGWTRKASIVSGDFASITLPRFLIYLNFSIIGQDEN